MTKPVYPIDKKLLMSVRGNVFKSLIARLMAGMMGRQIDKALSGVE